MPNSIIQGGGLTNYSTTGKLRLNLSFTISYESDLDTAKQILNNLLAEDYRVLSEPVVRVFVQDLGDHGVELVAWPFVKASDFAFVQAEVTKQARKAFDEAGIAISRPQQDVHLNSKN